MTLTTGQRSARPGIRKDVVMRMMAALRCRRAAGACQKHQVALYPTGDCPVAVKAVEAVVHVVAAHAWDEGAKNHPERIREVGGHVVGNPYVFQI